MGMKMARKMDFGLTRKMGETWPEKWEKWPEIPFSNHFRAIFSIFRAISLIFQAIFSPFFK